MEEFDQVSSDLSGFITGAPNVWAGVGSMTAPLFRGGTLIAEYRQAKASWEDAFACRLAAT